MKHRAILPTAALLAAATLSSCHLPRGSATQTAPATPAGIVTAAGHGWSASGLAGPVYGPGTCHYRHTGGEVLPDPACTPGALDPAVTQADLPSTVCRPGGYTDSVRPPERLTEPAKKQIMAAYGIAWSQAGHYELDHLLALSAGGASDTRNLWPEPDADAHRYQRAAFVLNDKDEIEAITFHALCRGTVSLAAVQKSVSANWATALAVLHLAGTR